MEIIEDHPDLTNSTVLEKPIEHSVPTLSMVTNASFTTFVPTGITLRVPIPLVKNSNDAIFGVNIDGFIPAVMAGARSPSFQHMRNLFPVQPTVTGSAIAGLEIEYSYTPLPAMVHYYTNRYHSGSVGVGVRITSNTALSGNFLLSLASGLIRDYKSETTPVFGVQSVNSSYSSNDYAYESFTTLDISLNRNVALTVNRRNPCVKTDFAQKLNGLRTIPASPTIANMPFNTQFAEDWIFFTPLADVLANESSSIYFTFFFDYSRMEFYTPMYSVVPFSYNGNLYSVLLWRETFIGAVGSSNPQEWVWVPISSHYMMMYVDTPSFSGSLSRPTELGGYQNVSSKSPITDSYGKNLIKSLNHLKISTETAEKLHKISKERGLRRIILTDIVKNRHNYVSRSLDPVAVPSPSVT